MQWEDVPTPEPGPGEALVRHAAVGLNYIDVYFRTGLYKTTLPATSAWKAPASSSRSARACTTVKPGDRVAYAAAPIGAYATERVIAADRLVKLPDGIDFNDRRGDDAAGHDRAIPAAPHVSGCSRARPILVHAAAGGVGLILCQWAKASGRDRDRRGLHPGEGGTRAARRRGARHRRPRRPAGGSKAHHRRRHGAGGVRQRRQRHLHGQPGLPGAARHDGQLRQRLGPGAASRSRACSLPRAACS